MRTIEEQIWEYIDGFCSEEEKASITKLIATDPQYKIAYQEALSIQQDLAMIELEEPSMGFTQKVMQQVALSAKPLSLHAMVDKRIIYFISGIFILMLGACFWVALSQVNWSAPIAGTSKVNLDQMLNSIEPNPETKRFAIYGFLMFNTIAGLMLMDKLLRKHSIK